MALLLFVCVVFGTIRHILLIHYKDAVLFAAVIAMNVFLKFKFKFIKTTKG